MSRAARVRSSLEFRRGYAAGVALGFWVLVRWFSTEGRARLHLVTIMRRELQLAIADRRDPKEFGQMTTKSLARHKEEQS